jgi:3-oxoadipate enol-lactonase
MPMTTTEPTTNETNDPRLPATARVPGVLWHKDRTVRTSDGADIAYTFLGPDDGPVVALCAGLLCPDTWWYHLAPHLAEAGYRVLVSHYRGMGTSSTPAEDHPDAYAIELCASDLVAIADVEALDELTLLGHSMGVQVALEAYRQLGSRVNGVALITGGADSPLRHLYDRGPLVTYGLYHPLRVALQGLHPPVRRAGWQALWTHVPMLRVGQAFKAFGPRTDDAIVRSYCDHVASLDPGMVLRIAAGMHAHDASDVLPQITVPTLVVAGGRDPFNPPSQAKRMAGLVRDAVLRVAPNGTHGTILEYPEVVNGWVLDFLDGVAPVTVRRTG